jgi:hypothetical protein
VLWEAIRHPSLYLLAFLYFLGRRSSVAVTRFADLLCSFVLSVSRILFTSMVEAEKMEMG